jgi:hypothetical protein
VTSGDLKKARTYLVPEAGAQVGLTRNGSYAAVGRGEIPVLRFGRLMRVPADLWDRIVSEGRPPPDPPSRNHPRR